MPRRFGDGKFYDWSLADPLIEQARKEGWQVQRLFEALPKDEQGLLPTFKGLESRFYRGQTKPKAKQPITLAPMPRRA
jgi:hypothetical protein